MRRIASFPPIVTAQSRGLVLGSMPGVASLRAGQYYAHPRNAFWPLLGSIFDCPVDTYDRRVALVCDHRLALWDVLAHCVRPGSLDADIDPKTAVANDFAGFFDENPGIRHVFFNGNTAAETFRRKVQDGLPAKVAARLTLHRLPSTSPAHAVAGDKKLDGWMRLRDLLVPADEASRP